jgi:hypothetical protein
MNLIILKNQNDVSKISPIILKRYKLLAFDLKIQSLLKESNIDYFNSLNFFSKANHGDVIKNTDILLDKIFLDLKKESYTDNKLKDYTFQLNFKFRLRGYLSKLLINFYILKNISKKYSKIYIFDKKKIVEYKDFIENSIFMYNETNTLKRNYIKSLFFKIYYRLFRFYLKYFINNKIIILNDNSYNLTNKMISLFRKSKSKYSLILICSNFKNWLKYKKKFSNLYPLFLNYDQGITSNNDVDTLLSDTNVLIKKSFFKLTKKKLNKKKLIFITNQIKKNLVDLISKEKILFKTFNQKKNIKLLVSQHSLETGSLLFKLSNINNIKSLCLSHGTYSYTSNKLANKEWDAHIETMINHNFDYIGSHSLMMTDFINKSHSLIKKNQMIKTEPFLFSTNQDLVKKKINIFKKLNFEKKDLNKKIILHANSPKFGRGLIYDSIDEYIHNISKTITHLDKKKYILVISFRRFGDLNSRLLKKLLPNNDNFRISTELPIKDLIDLSSIVVSHSSTVIEEAIFSGKPVLITDFQKKYNHFDNSIIKKYITYNNSNNLNYILNPKNLNKKIQKMKKFEAKHKMLFYKGYKEFFKIIK